MPYTNRDTNNYIYVSKYKECAQEKTGAKRLSELKKENQPGTLAKVNDLGEGKLGCKQVILNHLFY